MRATRLLATGLGAFALSIFGALSAQADEVVAAQPWEPLDALDDGSGFAQQLSANSVIVDKTTADLVWVDGITAGHGGTSVETDDLGLDVAAGTQVSVDYQLLDGADPASGAVRLFVYMSPSADTLTVGPDAFTIAPDDGSTSGMLSLNVPAAGTIGTVGFVYDTSNSAGGGVAGTVRFTDLAVGDDKVLFVEPQPEPEVCEWDAELLADDEQCVEPDDSEPEKETDQDTEAQSDSKQEADDTDSTPAPVPTAVPAGSQLPDTGVNPALIVLAGAGMVGLGVGGLWLRRRFDH